MGWTSGRAKLSARCPQSWVTKGVSCGAGSTGYDSSSSRCGPTVHPQVKPETSRFPCKELPHMPGSSTTPEGLTLALMRFPYCLPRYQARRPPDRRTFRGSMAGLCAPLPTLLTSSRRPPHGSGPMWIAIPSSQWTCTTYSLPVSPAH